MQCYITHAKAGRFDNDKGEEITYANVHILHHEKKEEPLDKGQKTIKLKTSADLVRSLDKVPGLYECDIMPGEKTSELVKATFIK